MTKAQILGLGLVHLSHFSHLSPLGMGIDPINFGDTQFANSSDNG